jgi:hypothetical protein
MPKYYDRAVLRILCIQALHFIGMVDVQNVYCTCCTLVAVYTAYWKIPRHLEGGGGVVLERRQTTQGKEEIYFCREAVSVRDSALNSCGTVFW